jgi:3-oxoacyl-[acyl-carrier-protein] synthase III
MTRPFAGGSIAGISYAFPRCTQTVRDLAARGQLESDPALLEEFGFSTVHVATDETPYELALEAGSALLAKRNVAPDSIDALFYAGTPTVAFAAGGSGARAEAQVSTMRRFHYPATRLQYDLGLERASVVAVDQLACTSLFASVRLANALCLAGEAERILCVSSEFFPSDAGRETIYNCTSDAACAVLVERGGERNRIVASNQVSKGYYWDCDAMRNEIVASYFPTAKHVAAQALARAGWEASDVRWVFPHNVSTRSWTILIGLLGIGADRLWSRNIARDGHTLAGDNFINLSDALESGEVQPGDRLLLFAYGFGAHWTALAVEA